MLDPAQLKDPDVLRHTVLDFRQMSAFVQNPLILDRADGVHYWDIDGKHYYDGISGIFVVAVGHNNRRIIEAMQAQMERLCFAPPAWDQPASHRTQPVAGPFGPRRAQHGQTPLQRLGSDRDGHEAISPVLEAGREADQVQVHLPLLRLSWRHARGHGGHGYAQTSHAL